MNNKNHQLLAAAPPRHWVGSAGAAAAKPIGVPAAAPTFGDANCMEQLLVHCANAIESNDATLAQQILWVLHNIATPDGDANQRLASAFLRALVARAARRGCSLFGSAAEAPAETHRFTVVELANFIDLTPWHRFGFTAANAAILDAAEGFPVVHIVEIGLTHCMQIPTLLDSFSSRHLDAPPIIKLTVVSDDHASQTLAGGDDFPPAIDLSYDELGRKLVAFARTRNLSLEFRVVNSSHCDGFASLIERLSMEYASNNCIEALVVNCQMRLHRIPEDDAPLRTMFLKALRALGPTAVVLVDEDADLSSNNLVSRLRSAFNYLWIPFDTVDTFLPRGTRQRDWYEADIGWRVENVVAGEGVQRVERQEPKARWAQRMRAARFRGVGFGEEAAGEVRAMLDEHAAGWGVKREDEDLVLTWKGHNVVFATVWVPA